MISDAIGWKFNHQTGMRCKEIDGVMTIIEFPGGLPSQADQDLWTQEYNDWIATGGDKDLQAQEILNSPLAISMMEEFIAVLDAGGIPVPVNVQDNIKERIKGKL